MRYYLGVDWADHEDAVWVEDEQARKIEQRTVARTPEAWAEWGRWLDERRAEGIELWAAIERPEGRVVDFLLDHGVTVYAINPKALERARDRFRMSGAKSDPFDARVLATLLRTEHTHLAALQPSSPEAQELKALTRDHARQVRQRTRLLNQLIVTLKEYYPRALEVCDDLTAQWARTFLRDYPTPTALHPLTERQWQRWARTQRLGAERVSAAWALLQRSQLPVPPHVERVKARRLAVLLEQLDVTHGAVEAYRQEIHRFFSALPAASWATTLPGGQRGTTIPALYAELGDAPARWQTLQHLQGQAGTVPVTDRSGKGHVVKFRFACNTHLRTVVHHLAFGSLRHSDWARAYYDRCRARGHSHHHALRALGAKWLKIIFVLWTRGVPYSEQHHLASIARHHLRQPV